MVDWEELETLAEELGEPGAGPGSFPEASWLPIRRALGAFLATEDWSAVIRLRELLTALYARDAVGGLRLLQRLDNAAIEAAKRLGDKRKLAHLFGAKGHNLHRQGYHQAAIDALEASAVLYQEIGEPFESLKNHYMTSLCHRALGDRERAKQIVIETLQQVDENDPWRGNPLAVMAWLAEDDGDLQQAEHLLREALFWHDQGMNTQILVAQTLADLGVVLSARGCLAEADTCLQESLAILEAHKGQYDRQEARTLLKYSQLQVRLGKLGRALELLDQADDRVRLYGHYFDLMWRIELARALVYVREGRFRRAYGKWRVSLRYRRTLGLPLKLLMWQVFRRLFRRARYRFRAADLPGCCCSSTAN